jgi:hypothetical protein
MKKMLVVGGVLAGAAFLVKRFASSRGQLDFERLFERMPDNAPPKWMFNNISAIRENTERILQRLEREHAPAGAGPANGPA